MKARRARVACQVVLRAKRRGMLLQASGRMSPSEPNTMGRDARTFEVQTFKSETFDLVVTQDVMEHVFRPDLVYQEIHRKLRQGGFYIHTAPINASHLPRQNREQR